MVARRSTIFLAFIASCAAFAPIHKSCSRQSTKSYALHDNDNIQVSGRRDVIQKLLILQAMPAIVTNPAKVNAASELFKLNPLTNPVLEKIRIWNQDEADNIQYNGELASGSSGPAAFDQYVQLLQPIMAVERDIAQLDTLLNNASNGKEEYMSTFKQMDKILNQPNFDKLTFKKAFNAFADNIYYSDPDRANLYLGGGATPGATQSLAYLLRNEVLTNVEDMRAEVAYLIREMEKGNVVGEGGLDLGDLFGFVKGAKESMGKYLDLVPPKELEAARAKFG